MHNGYRFFTAATISDSFNHICNRIFIQVSIPLKLLLEAHLDMCIQWSMILSYHQFISVIYSARVETLLIFIAVEN